MLSDEEISRMVMMRGLGFSQSEIAKELGVTQGAVSYNLKQLKMQAGKEGLEAAYMKVMVAGVGIGRLREAGLI